LLLYHKFIIIDIWICLFNSFIILLFYRHLTIIDELLFVRLKVLRIDDNKFFIFFINFFERLIVWIIIFTSFWFSSYKCLSFSLFRSILFLSLSLSEFEDLGLRCHLASEGIGSGLLFWTFRLFRNFRRQTLRLLINFEFLWFLQNCLCWLVLSSKPPSF